MEDQGQAQAEAETRSRWREAQSIPIGVDLVSSALQMLRLLERVDQHPCLYRGPAVARAIHRYENCWLPLLSKHQHRHRPLQPPFDCAWIWHCHRLHPVQYIKDCETLYGQVLDSFPPIANDLTWDEVVETSKSLWEDCFPNEKYDLDLTHFAYDTSMVSNSILAGANVDEHTTQKIKYNLEDAVARQRTFYYQVSQPHMRDKSFLRVANDRYKGFLYLFKKTNCNVFLVPTYDIDLMWHAHQLSPKAYKEDMLKLLGRVLDHDDTDSDRTVGYRLDEGFNKTRLHWQNNFGGSYERAGAMYRGEPPAMMVPMTSVIPSVGSSVLTIGTPMISMVDVSLLMPRQVIQVSITTRGAKIMHKMGKGKMRVRMRVLNKASNLRLETPTILYASNHAEWKEQWSFQSELSTRGVQLELLHRHSSPLKQKVMGSKCLGCTNMLWQTLLASPTLSYDGWIALPSSTASTLSQNQSHQLRAPSMLNLSVSITPPQPAPYLLRAINSFPTNDEGRMTINGPGLWLSRTVLDHANCEVFIIRTRYSEGSDISSYTKDNEKSILIHQGGWDYMMGRCPANTIATAKQLLDGVLTEEFSTQRCWNFFDNNAQLYVHKNIDDPLWNIQPHLELKGNIASQVRLISGRRLDYEVKEAKEEDEAGFVTLIRFNALDAPIGNATALFNWQTGAMEVTPQESVVLVLLLSTIIAVSIFEMEGLSVKLNKRQPPTNKSTISSDEWGSIILDSRRTSSTNKSMIPYYCWWDMSPIIWASMFYNSNNVLYGGSGCGAAGACGGGTGGGSACGGGTCGGGGCGGGGCGGGGCGG